MRIKLSAVIALVSLFVGMQAYADPIVTESTSNSTVTTNGNNKTTVKSPPPSAISPSINNSNAD